ncbi:MAG: LytR C-terminal domain-containing protein [Solirubrobacterales bacterium]|nr:LytR C-terminal domain-containing protein [Solirubrobacterales bacterium]
MARGPAPAIPAAAQADDGGQPPAAGSHPDDGSRTPPSGDELDVTKMDTVVHPPPSADDDDEDGADLDATAIAPPATAAAAAAAGARDDDAVDEVATEERDDRDEDRAGGEGYGDDEDRDGEDDFDEEPDDRDDRTEAYETGEFDTGEQGEWRPEDEHSGYPFTDEHELAPLTPPGGTPGGTPRPPSPPPPYQRRGVQPATASGGDSGRILPPYEESRPGAASEPVGDRPGAGVGRRRVLAIVGAGVAVAVLVFGGLQLTGGSEPSEEPSVGLSASSEDGDGGAGGNGGGGGAADEPVDPAQVTVAVLNGTTVAGLAATIGDQVGDEGFVLGTVTNSFDQERAESVVLYAPGAEAEAAEVGRRLGISQREQIDAESQALAGDATVVVVAGADQAQQ